MIDILLLILALAGLWVGAELIIKGSVEIARHYKISELFIGLTIVAFGTDLPELFISATAAVDKLRGFDTSGLVVGQAIGSSFSQIALMFGILGLIAVIKISKKELFRDGAMLLMSIILLFLLALDGQLSRTDGAILLAFYLFYFFSLLRREQFREKIFNHDRGYRLWSIISLIAGFGILLYASDLTIESALAISQRYHIAQRYIGILLVGLGTSLPELVTTVSAIKRRAGSLAVGNLLGSTIFDLLFALGLGVSISGFSVNRELAVYDIPLLFIVCAITLIMLSTGKKLYRIEAIFLLVIYLIYFIARLSGGLAGMV